MEMYRQGDVLIVEVESLPEEARAVKRGDQLIKGKGIVLAAGEATGHHHVVKDKHTRLFTRGPSRFIKTCKHGATITHEEHDPIVLPASKVFQIVRQKEYNPPRESAPARMSYVYD